MTAKTDHGFVRTADGTVTSFDYPGALITEGYSINSNGAVAGWWGNAVVMHGLLRTADGRLKSFDCPGASNTLGLSINRAGTIAGACFFNDSFHGFFRTSNGTITTVDAPHSVWTEAVGIDDKGAITGFYYDAKERSYGFVRNPAGIIKEFFVQVDGPGIYSCPCGTSPTAINDAGAIVGTADTKGGLTYGFLRTK